MILPTAYFPNIYYLTQILNNKTIEIDLHENFVRKTYRNRCEILAANGKLTLTVPVVKPNPEHKIIKDIRIDYCTNWQKQHFKSIESAYQSSPFYEYIIDDFSFVFENKTKFLIDLNQQILDAISEYIVLETAISTSNIYVPSTPREHIRNHFKSSNTKLQEHHYTSYRQTFSDRFPFVCNLSVLDLLFNCGALAKSILI